MASIFWAQKSFFEVAEKKMNPKELIVRYRALVNELVYTKKRIKNPVNLKLKNGKPLAKSTIEGFKQRISAIREELDAYKASIKWLTICGYWKRNRREKGLTPEQQFLKWALSRIVRSNISQEAMSKLRDKNKMLQRLLEVYAEDRDNWKEVAEEWKNLRPRDQEETSKPTKSRVIPFKILDGGKKVEEEPPFATNP
jgi:hypothetical protein